MKSHHCFRQTTTSCIQQEYRQRREVESQAGKQDCCVNPIHSVLLDQFESCSAPTNVRVHFQMRIRELRRDVIVRRIASLSRPVSAKTWLPVSCPTGPAVGFHTTRRHKVESPRTVPRQWKAHIRVTVNWSQDRDRRPPLQYKATVCTRSTVCRRMDKQRTNGSDNGAVIDRFSLARPRAPAAIRILHRRAPNGDGNW